MPSLPVDGPSSGNVFLSAIQWGGWYWSDGGGAGTNITYLLAPGGTNLTEVFGSGYGTSINWTASQETAYEAALQQWANVANITFTQVYTYAEADLVEFIYNNSGSSILGVHETPDSAYYSDGTAWGAYNQSGAGFDASGLQAGGYGFITFVHELGHALGLAHPHDNGGGSGLFPGVSDSGDTGDNDLNQGIFTLMSYLDGWRTVMGSPPGYNYGWQSGPMAFDIAAIQYLYGANMSYNTGNNTYVLGNIAGNEMLSCIWDAGGTDTIQYNGSYGCTIDLRPATLANAPGGGGFVSWVNSAPTNSLDHWNAYTIANGVTIENATGGSGADSIYLSSASVNNLINGNGGSDTVYVSYSYGAGYAIQAGSTASNLVMIGSAGTDTLQNCEWVHFANGATVSTASLISAPPSNDAFYDFNGNGTSDILWYNTSNYAVGQYVMNNGVATWAGIGSGAANWQIVGAGDFNGNGTDDVLWYNTSNYQVGQFIMTNGVASWAMIATAGAGWQVVGVGDFNGNGTDDILWYNPTTHQLGQYVMNNGAASWAGIATLSSNWSVVGVGDFNGNGTDDILFHNAVTNQVGQFVMNNGVPSWAMIATAGAGWQVAGIGDFNGNGTDDVLWYNPTTHQLGQYVMNNGVASWAGIATLSLNWSIAAIGDYNGGGTDDILFHNMVTNQVGQFVMNSGVPSWAMIATAGAGWAVV